MMATGVFECKVSIMDTIDELTAHCLGEISNSSISAGDVAAFTGAAAAIIAAGIARKAWITSQKQLEHTRREDHMARIYGATNEMTNSLQTLIRLSGDKGVVYRKTRDETYTVAIAYRLTAAPHLDFETWRWIVRWMLNLAGLRHEHILKRKRGTSHGTLAFQCARSFVRLLSKYAEVEDARTRKRYGDRYDLVGNLRKELMHLVAKNGLENDPKLVEIEHKLGKLSDGPNWWEWK